MNQSLDLLDLDIESYDDVNIEELLVAINSIEEPVINASTTVQTTDNNKIFGLACDYNNDYDDYSHIERHIEFSESLYNINKRGIYILEELKRKNDSSLIDSMITTIKLTTKCKLMGTCTLMNELYCYLDQLMFSTIDENAINVFFIDDDTYPLTNIYYGQDNWLGDRLYFQAFEFDKRTEFNDSEMMIIACFYNDYMTLLEKIVDYIETLSIHQDTTKPLITNIGKITGLLDRAKVKLLDKIGNNINMLET